MKELFLIYNLNIRDLKRKVNFVGLFLFLCLFFCSNIVIGGELDSQWLKLLRYNKTLTGFESEVDYEKYFFSEEGKYSPKKELAASINAFNATYKLKNINEHPICLFPGRYLYLKEKGYLNYRFNLDQCEDFKQFKEKINLKSVSVIFSSFYINKPASAFGHTLFKLNSTDPLKSDLNSYGVDFSARVTTSNPFLYGLLGITGGFYGRFSLMPYFLKLREYNDYESRDLWEIELLLSKKEQELFLAHLWDMNLALFDYYYFSENCSYHILRFLDAIRPSWNLMKDISSTTIPVDTLKPLLKKDRYKGIYFRPSLYKRTLKKLKKLDQSEVSYLKRSLQAKKLPRFKGSVPSETKTLDTLIDFVDYKYSKKIFLDKKDRIHDFKQDILLRRSELPIAENENFKEVRSEMNLGSSPAKFSFAHRGGNQESHILKYRSALHNIYEKEGDVYSTFSLEMNELTLVNNIEKDRAYVEKWKLAHVFALRPINALETQISWKFNIGAKNNETDILALNPFMDVSIGYSYTFNFITTYIMAKLDEGAFFTGKEIAKYGPLVGFVSRGDNLTYHFELESMKEFYDSSRTLAASFHYLNYYYNQNDSLFINYEKSNLDEKTEIGLSFNF